MKLSKGNHEQFSDVQPISTLRVIHKWRPHAYVVRPFIDRENVPVREESREDEEIDSRIGANIWGDGRIDGDSKAKFPGTAERDAFSSAATFFSVLILR
jgi:hypothetical protein